MLHKNNSLTFFLILISLLQCCTSSSIITADKPLRDDGNVLVSPAENFALGFFSPGNGNSSNSRRYVGIWYNKVSPQTVVWVANRDSPVTNHDGVLTLDESTGNLVLFDSQKPDVVIWRSSNVSESSAVVGSNYSVELLDSGNLVVSKDGKTNGFVWQSFDFPTDTLLSNMKLGVDRRSGLNRFLTSWKSPDDPGTGSYSLMVDVNGSVLPQLFLYKNRQPIWRGGPWNGRAWSGVPEMAADFIFNISYVDNAEEVYLVDYMRNTSIISRMIVNESTGTVQRITWKHDEHKWFTFYSAPKDQCDGFRYCGDFGYCGIHIVGEPECNCLPGFKPKSVQDWYLRDGSQGCIQKRDGQMCGNGEGFVKVAGAKVPDTTKTRLDKNLGHEACADMCLKNCSCTGYSSADVRGGGFNGCITWYDKLVDFREYQSGGQDFYIRVDAVELANYRKKSKKFHTYIRVLVIVPLSAAFFVLLTLAYWFIMTKRRGIAQRRQESMLWFTSKINDRRISVHGSPKGEEVNEMGTSTVDVKLYPLSTIITATENFSIAHKLGEGGFGSVYKGKLHNGQDFAVKRLSNTSGQGIEEFRNEVTLIAKLQHINLVRLVGYCIQKEEKMLIYEYLPNKGLDCFLFDKEKKHMLDWRKRFDITVGIARGMAYLHHESRLKIIHRDLKASNILLDANLNPKISDFGMARMFRNDQIEEMTTRVVGTYGYMSPEYAMDGLFSTKSDVFSFGVLLLEIITGRKNSSYHVENFGNLIGHVWDLWEKSKVLDIVDQSLGELHEHNPNILRCIHVGLLCVQESATARPSMSEVVFMLCNETNLPSPSQAAFILRTSNQGPSKTSSSSVGAISVNEVTISTVEGR